jgi:hypothetical protein
LTPKAGLQAAVSVTAALDVSRAAVQAAQQAGEAVVNAAVWLANLRGPILDVKKI